MRLARYICPDILARMRPAITDDRATQRMIDLILVAFVAACVFPVVFQWLSWWTGR